MSKEDQILKSNPFFVTWLIFGLSATSLKSATGSRKWMVALLFLVGMLESSLSRDPGDAMLYNDWPYTLKETADLAKYVFPVLLVAILLWFERGYLAMESEAEVKR